MLAMGFEEADAELYLRTTDEMLEEFIPWPELAREVVITAPHKIAALIEPALEPVPSKFTRLLCLTRTIKYVKLHGNARMNCTAIKYCLK